MSSPRVVLVTGVSRYLGSRLAGVLAADPSIERVIGVDTVAPRPQQSAVLGRTEFVRADIRNPLIAKVIAQAGVEHEHAFAACGQCGREVDRDESLADAAFATGDGGDSRPGQRSVGS